jgi:hypothetical protein
MTHEWRATATAAVLSYVRVSTDEQANGYGPDVQRERIEQFCRQERLPRSPASPAPAS